jgi:hypothetical protein
MFEKNLNHPFALQWAILSFYAWLNTPPYIGGYYRLLGWKKVFHAIFRALPFAYASIPQA